ncbi:methyltransferase-like protein 7A isoform X2 [Mangifera indica]|uniref:methyltransferase-like protein 7A isoform X2 n=1 Tax=Mangifera indica TaxID=29780 RepID=UPI001CFB31E5|nr:methyltransferase-like protein 7A isoform X2 [Mangifera indica]
MIIPSYSLPSSFFINIKVTCSSQKTKLPIARERLTLCSCGRRHFIEAATTTALLPLKPSSSSELLSDYTRVHPPRPNWYEEFYASVMNSSMDSYEAEIAVYKSQIFGNLRGNAEKVLEIGIGTGPNLKYYANDPNIQVFGVDPNIKMEKYAQAAAVATGLPLTNFKFLQAVGEAIPLRDESVDAVVGTLVLCSVKDVGMTLQEVKRVLKPSGLYVFVEHVAAKDGTLLKFWQSVLDPIQQIVADGCHLTRESGKDISEAGFSGLEVGNVYLSNASLINPHVYGIACK